MKHEIAVGILYSPVDHGHLPQTYVFNANVINAISGSYGISGGAAYKKRAFIEIDLPDDVVPSKKWNWPLSIPGRKSKSGSDDLCFVECGKTATKECDFFGSLDPEKLILEALESGVYFIFPNEKGEMERKKIDYKITRWLDW